MTAPRSCWRISAARRWTGCSSTERPAIPAFLELAIAIATAQDQVHQHGVIHKDINPSNIVARLQAREVELEVELIDFGIAWKGRGWWSGTAGRAWPRRMRTRSSVCSGAARAATYPASGSG